MSRTRRRMRMMMMEETLPHPYCYAIQYPYALVKMVPEQEAPVAHEVILVDAEPEPPQPCFYDLLMRDYEEIPSMMMDDPHELDDLIEANYDVDEWHTEDGSND
jgi:hypothetical protein